MNTRRTFLKTSLGFAGALSLGFVLKKKSPRLSFSTLGCPKWTLRQIVNSAVSNGYQAVEFRGLEGEVFLPKRPEFSTEIAATRTLFADHGIAICNLGSSATLHFADPATRTKNLDEGRSFIDVAHKLGCPYVRVFPNNFPKDQDKKQTMDLIAQGLLKLGDYAKGAQVTVLLESHGDLIYKDELLQVMQQAEHSNVALIWDIFNMWSVTKEPPAEVFKTLRKYIRHTHVKDARNVDGKYNYVLTGEGETPLAEAINALKSSGYAGYYSFEWEKMWHPEIADPEVAMPHYPKVMRKLLK